MKTDSNLARVENYIKETLPWAHGHQVKSLATIVDAIFSAFGERLGRISGESTTSQSQGTRSLFLRMVPDP
jgi:hypothetical protein